MFHGFKLHSISERPLTRQDVFPLKIAVHHKNDRGIIIHFPDNDRQGLQTGKLCLFPKSLPLLRQKSP